MHCVCACVSEREGESMGGDVRSQCACANSDLRCGGRGVGDRTREMARHPTGEQGQLVGGGGA